MLFVSHSKNSEFETEGDQQNKRFSSRIAGIWMIFGTRRKTYLSIPTRCGFARISLLLIVKKVSYYSLYAAKSVRTYNG